MKYLKNVETIISVDLMLLRKTSSEAEKLKMALNIVTTPKHAGSFFPKLVEIFESGCSTCKQVSKAADTVTRNMEVVLNSSYPDWLVDKSFQSSKKVINKIRAMVPSWCPESDKLTAI